MSLSVKFRQKFTDYAATDYLLMQFKNYENVLFLADPDISTNISATLSTAAATSSMAVAVDNHTQIRAVGLGRLLSNADVSEVKISGLYNPATIQPIVTNTSGFQIIVTLMSANASLK